MAGRLRDFVDVAVETIVPKISSYSTPRSCRGCRNSSASSFAATQKSCLNSVSKLVCSSVSSTPLERTWFRMALCSDSNRLLIKGTRFFTKPQFLLARNAQRKAGWVLVRSSSLNVCHWLDEMPLLEDHVPVQYIARQSCAWEETLPA